MERRYLLLALPLVVSCCVYIASRGSSEHQPPPSLQRAFIAFRHGTRAPTWTYKNDPHVNKTEFWPEGYTYLTKKGKMEAYELGKRLRERYGEFIGDYYDPAETRAFTTLIERTMMSGQLVLASLFPPVGYQKWNKELPWQPVPLYPEYVVNDTVGSSCLRFPSEVKQNMRNVIKNFNPESWATIKKVMQHSGEPNGSPWHVYARVWDTVYFQERADLPIPKELEDIYPEKMSKLAVLLVEAFLSGSDALMKLVIHNYAAAVSNFLLAKDARKVEIHSWHDVNNMALLTALDVKYDFYPEPTSCIVIELHNNNGQESFEVYYYDSYKSQQPRQLEMPCGLSCPIDVLADLGKKHLTSNYTELCQSGPPQTKSDKFLGQLKV